VKQPQAPILGWLCKQVFNPGYERVGPCGEAGLSRIGRSRTALTIQPTVTASGTFRFLGSIPCQSTLKRKRSKGRQVANVEFHVSSFVVMGGAYDTNRRSSLDMVHFNHSILNCWQETFTEGKALLRLSMKPSSPAPF